MSSHLPTEEATGKKWGIPWWYLVAVWIGSIVAAMAYGYAQGQSYGDHKGWCRGVEDATRIYTKSRLYLPPEWQATAQALGLKPCP